MRLISYKFYPCYFNQRLISRKSRNVTLNKSVDLNSVPAGQISRNNLKTGLGYQQISFSYLFWIQKNILELKYLKTLQRITRKKTKPFATNDTKQVTLNFPNKNVHICQLMFVSQISLTYGLIQIAYLCRN